MRNSAGELVASSVDGTVSWVSLCGGPPAQQTNGPIHINCKYIDLEYDCRWSPENRIVLSETTEVRAKFRLKAVELQSLELVSEDGKSCEFDMGEINRGDVSAVVCEPGDYRVLWSSFMISTMYNQTHNFAGFFIW